MKDFFNTFFSLNKPLSVLLATNSAVCVAIAMLAPLWAIFVGEVGGGILETGLAFSILAITAGVVVIFAGKITDQVKENELILVLGYVLLGTGFMLYVFVSNVWFLGAIQIVVGLGLAIQGPPFDAIYSKHLKKHATGVEWGALEGTIYMAKAIGAALGAYVVATFGFNVLFVSMAILCFGSAVYIYFLPRRVL